MVNEVDIANALQKRVSEIQGFPRIVWENKEETGKPPYALVDIVPAYRTSDYLDGLGVRSVGYMVVTVVWAAGSLATQARIKMQEVLDQFPPTLQLNIPSGRIVIENSSPLMGYNDDVYWRQPCRVDYYAF